MDDQNTGQGSEPPATGTPLPEQGEQAKPESKDSGVYAAYDKQLQRYVGGTHASKAKARDAAKAKSVASGDIEIRQV